MSPRPLNRKPGSRENIHRPDVIETFDVGTPTALLPFLIESMPDRKRTNIKELLTHSQVAVNDNPVTQFDTPLQPGDSVKVNFVRPFLTFRHRRLRLVYEDDDIIVIEKGYGLLSMATDKSTGDTAYSILRDYVKWSDPANKIFIVHRLDRDTSGLMMFAKNQKSKETMQYNWNNMVLDRTYVCVVDGYLDKPEGTIRSYLNENSRHEVYSTDKPEGPDSKLAVTRYRTIAAGHGHTLLEVSLDTGRKNQIRVHMKELGHPIVGDRRYGGSKSPIHRLALHARTLRFVHPETRREMNFSTPVPQSFRDLI